MLQALERLSLRTAEARLAALCQGSLVLQLLGRLGGGLRHNLQTLARHSLLARALPAMTLWACLALLFISPFVSSDETAILVLLVATLTGLRLLLVDEAIPISDFLGLTILLFMALGLVAVAFSPYPKLALYGYAKLTVYVIAYFCFLINLRSLSHIRRAAWAIILAAFVMALYGLYQYHIKVAPLALWDDPESTYQLTRVYSFLGNPNLLGGYLLATLSVTLFFFYGNLGWRKLVLLAAFFAQLLCLYFTYSRGVWVGLVGGALVAMAACLVIFWPKFSRSRLFKYAAVLGVVALVAVAVLAVMKSPAMLERVSSLLAGRQHSSNSFRMNVWLATFDMLKDFWVMGIGIGNKVFQKVYTFYMVPGFEALSTYNVLLEVWVEMGIFGLLGFLGMLSVHQVRCLWGIIKEIDYTARLFLAAALCAIVAQGTHGMVDTVWFRPPIQILFWFLMAIISIVSRDDIAFNNTLTK